MLSVPFALVGEVWLMWWLGYNLTLAVIPAIYGLVKQWRLGRGLEG